MRKIIQVKPTDDYVLEILLNNNHKIICDMKTRLKGIRFQRLREIKCFKNVQIKNPYTITWDNNCEITIDEVIAMLEQ